MTDESMVYALLNDNPPLTLDELWKEVVCYLSKGSGDPSARRLLEETLVVLAELSKVPPKNIEGLPGVV
jgi:hypothetical protein